MVQVIPTTITTPGGQANGMIPRPDTNPLRQQGLAAISQLPPFSPILSKLMASLGSDEVSFANLGDLIEKDAVLAGRLMGIVNSALYARRSTISSVRHALSVLGMEKLRNTVLCVSVSCMLNQARTPSGWSMERFNKHSAAVAILSDLIAQRVPVEYPEGAFVAGLLHDMGRLLEAIGLPKQFHSMLREYQGGGGSWLDCERATLGFTHPELSAAALAVWKVPEPIQRAALHHHEPDPARSGGDFSLGWVVHAANQYINSTGETILTSPTPDCAGAHWMESLGLDQDGLAGLLADFHAEHTAIAHYFH